MIPTIAITTDILKLIADIDEFKGKWGASQALSAHHRAHLRTQTIIENSIAALQLSGMHFSKRVAKQICNERGDYSFARQEEKQLLSYIETLDYISQQCGALLLSESTIKQLHVMLQKFTTKPLHVQGGYKRIPNSIVVTHQPGCDNSAIRSFRTSKPFESPTHISQLMQWLDKVVREDAMHPLIIWALWLGLFLTISPFQEGNKRTACAISCLMLLKFGYSFSEYNSLIQVFEQDYDMFYDMLAVTQADKEDGWQQWVVYVLRCVRKQKNTLLHVLDEAYFQEQEQLHTLSLRILELLQQHNRLGIADLVEHTGANRNTVKLRLRELAAAHYIQKNGKARATWYTAA